MTIAILNHCQSPGRWHLFDISETSK